MRSAPPATDAEPPFVASSNRTETRPGLGQPALGVAGLFLVVPVAAALAVGAGPDSLVLVLGPLITSALPFVAMVAFWWEDWPGTRLRAGVSGWADTAVIAVGAIVLTGLAQVIAGGLDVSGLFEAAPGPGHVPTFPATLPVAGTAFVVMLELTLVGEGWPLDRVPWIPAGLVVLAVSVAAGVVVDLTLVEIRPLVGSAVTARGGPVPGDDLAAGLVLIGAVQVLVYVLWRGWPCNVITSRARRLAVAHVAVIGSGIIVFVVARHALAVEPTTLTAVAGCFVAACLLLGMQFDLHLLPGMAPRVRRLVALLAAASLALVLFVTLRGLAGGLPVHRVSTDRWVEHASLNALATSIILHVGVGRRWPFRPAAAPVRSDGPGAR